MKRRPVLPRYCSRCRVTTRHVETYETSTCQNCGEVKNVDRINRSTQRPHAGMEAENSLWN